MQTRLGKYTLLERLAVGGMAELFLAKANAQHGFEKTVVLKRILPAFAQNEDFVDMFMQEAHLAAGLHHPNIAQVFDFGEEKGTYFFTMEYVQGKNLREVLHAAAEKRIGFPLASVLHVVTGIAAGLHHAHEHRDTDGQPLGVVHRDVSPSNVIVTYDGHIKIVDFGIAKAAVLGSGTRDGALKGKVPYMSPEQCRGEVVDRRSDIFSIGTLLWELSTAQRLFHTEGNEVALLHRVANAEVPAPTSVLPKYPAELESLVLKALAKERNDRFSTAQDLLVALEDFAHGARLALSPTRMARYMDDLFPRDERPHVPLTGAFASLSRNATTPTNARTVGASVTEPGAPPRRMVVPTPEQPARHSGTPVYAWAVGVLVVCLGLGGAAWALTGSTPLARSRPTAVAPRVTPEPVAVERSTPPSHTPTTQPLAAAPPAQSPQADTPEQRPTPANTEGQEPSPDATEHAQSPTIPPPKRSRRARARKRGAKRSRKRARNAGAAQQHPGSSSPFVPSDPKHPNQSVFLPSRASQSKSNDSSDDFL